MKKLFLILAAVTMTLPAFARKEKQAADSARIFFRQDVSVVELNLKGNKEQLDHIFAALEKAIAEGKVEKLSIVATASPEGGYEHNQQLSRKRADAIIKMITDKYPIPERKIESIAGGVAWDGLRSLVETLDIPERQQVLDIIDNEPEVTYDANGKTITNRLNKLKKLKCYSYLLKTVFPKLRSGVALQLFLFPVPEDQMPQYLAKKAKKEKQEPEPFAWALKSNLLYDAALIPNIGAEFYLGNGWTVGAIGQFAWWNGKKAHNWWRTIGADIEGRKYFGDKPFTGHHLGVYARAKKWDFQLAGTKGNIEDWNLKKGCGYQSVGWNFGGGVSYGYEIPIASCLNLDFEVGLGYLFGKNWEYQINPALSLDQQPANVNTAEWYKKTTTEPRPNGLLGLALGSRAGVTLVWIIGNNKK